MAPYWAAFPTLRDSLYTASETPYSAIKAEDVDACVSDNHDVKAWAKKYADILAPLPNDLHSRLVDGVMTVGKDQEESAIAAYLFEKLSPLPLIDKYQAFQILDNNYRPIATDLEIIQTEGFDATRVIEPHMVVKKKDGEDEEVQDGWQGRVLPFELVQRKKLPAEYQALQAAIETAATKEAELEDIKQLFNEEDLQPDFYDDEKQSFISKGVNARVKAIRKELKGTAPEPESLEETLLAFFDKGEELKAAKKQVKTLTADLLAKTMSMIPTLSDDDVKKLLHDKWITPLCEQLGTVPGSILDGFTASVKRLDKKYARTLQRIEQEKKEVEGNLSELLGNLAGNEYDMAAFKQLKEMIGGSDNE